MVMSCEGHWILRLKIEHRKLGQKEDEGNWLGRTI